MGRDKLRAYEANQAARRAAAVQKVEELVSADRYDEAEQLMRATDDSIQGSVMLAQLYRARLEQFVAAGMVESDRARVEGVYERAKQWAYSTYPTPHTAMEAEDYEAGRAEDRARLVGILGYEP